MQALPWPLKNTMNPGHGHKANDVFAPRGAQQSEVSASEKCLEYEPFGSLMPGRNYSSDAYRFGFNGQEKDDEVYGATGTSLNFGDRIYDSRIGRWLSTDPYAVKYPSSSPYEFALNSPILAKDVGGDSVWVTTAIEGDRNVITIHATIKVLDLSDGPIDINAVASDFQSKLHSAMWMNGRYQVYRTDVKVTVVTSASDVKPTDHLMVVVDHVTGTSDKDGPAGGRAPMGGQVAYVEYSTDANWLSDALVHEFGHNMNLAHTWSDDIDGNDNDPSNYMSYDTKGSLSFSWEQLGQIVFSFNQDLLNQGSPTAKSTTTSNNWFWGTSTEKEPWDFNTTKGKTIPTPLK